MGIGNPLTCRAGAKSSNVGGVEKYIDTAFDDIQKVANNLEALLKLNDSFVNLQGIYLGSFTTNPTQRTNGNSLENGDHFLNSTTSLLYVYLDGNWIYHSIFFTQSSLNQAVGQGPFNIWVAYADDAIGTGISLNPTGKAYTGLANNQTTSVVSIADPGQFVWSQTIGVDGVNSYIHVAYATSSDGLNNFSFTTGTYLGVYVDTIQTDSNNPNSYNWNIIKGTDGIDAVGIAGQNGTSVVVTDLGGGRISISDGVSTVFLDDGEIPTLVDNGDGTFTITSGIESITVTDGVTPLIGIDYFDGNNGDYVSFIYGNVPKGDTAPTVNSGTGTWNGTIETFPTGSIAWSDNANFVEGMTTFMSQNRYRHAIATDTWSLRTPSWSTPTIFIDKADDASQGQIKAFAFLRNSVIPPSAPTGGNFLNPTPTTGGWFDGIPAGTLPIWVVTATFTSDGLTPQNAGSPVIWSNPQLLAENGLGFKHRFSANQIGPWSDTPTTTDEWMITSVRDSAGIWVDDTSNPIRIKGETGATQQTSLRSFAFKRSINTSFVETPTGGNFASPNPVDDVVTGWTDGIPAGTARLYVSTRMFTSDGLTPQQAVWAESQVFSYNGEGYRTRFSIDGLTNWHLEPTVNDVYMWPQTSPDGGVTWADVGDPIKIKGESALGHIDLNFSPGVFGGAGDFIYTLNNVAGVLNLGELRIQGNTFNHPDGTPRTLQVDTSVNTSYGEGVAGRFYLMWSDVVRATRFPTGSWGGATNLIPIRIVNGVWEAFDDLDVSFTLTIIVTDCIVASVEAESITNGLTGIAPLTGGLGGTAGLQGEIGVSGDTVAQITVYQKSATTPAAPTGGSFDFGTSLISPPAGWSTVIPAGTDPLYASITIARITGTTGVDSTLTWGAPDIMAQNGIDGTNGTNGITGNSVYQAIVFQRAATAPSTPVANSGSFDFTTNILTPPVGWSTSVPAGTNPIYSTLATFSISGATGTDSTQTWTTPIIFVQNGIDGVAGTNGLSTYMYNVFLRAASAPATPTGGSFNFGTNVGSPPTSWANSPPAGSNPLYISTALASVVGNTGTDSGLTWTVPVIFSQDGAVGGPGTAGQRGTKHYYTTTTGGVWSDTVANAVITGQGDTKIIWDVVTISDTANAFSQTRYWDGAAWTVITEVIDGNLIVIGTIAANRIITGSLTAIQIAANTITANEIAANTITATQIAVDTITTNELAANSVTATEINVTSLQAVSANMGTVTVGAAQQITLNGANNRIDISDGTVTRVRIGNLGADYGMQLKRSNGEIFLSASGRGIFETTSTVGARNMARGLSTGTGRDGDVITFGITWLEVPIVKFSAGGLSFSSALTGDQFQDIVALNVTTTGFTIRAKITELAGSTTLHTDISPTSAGTQDWEIHKSQAAQAFDDAYKFQYDVTISNELDTETSTFLPGFVTVTFYTKSSSGGAWIARGISSHLGGTAGATTLRSNQTKTIVVDDLTNHSGREFAISITSDQVGGSTSNFDNVTYTTAVAPTTVTATPVGAPNVQYFILGGE